MTAYYAACLAAALTYHLSALSTESREQLTSVLHNVQKAGSGELRVESDPEMLTPGPFRYDWRHAMCDLLDELEIMERGAKT